MAWTNHVSQFLGYYPKYLYLDDILSVSGRSTLNIYIDLKGCMQSLFQEWAVKYVISQSRDTRMVDTSVFSSVLEFLSWHKVYAKKRNIKLNMYIFFESGKSSYHLDIYSEYKKLRTISDFFGLDLESKELFFKIMDKNYYVIDKVCNKLPDTYVIRLKYLEADFIPYYLMNCVFSKEAVNNSAHVIYSTDKDMLQCLDDGNNKFQYYKHYRNIKTLLGKDIYTHFLKQDLEIDHTWFPLVLAIIGDVSDGFDGVRGIGPITLAKVIKIIVSLCGNSIDDIYLNIKEKKSIFNKPQYESVDKKIHNHLKLILDSEDIIIRNLKLLSFKMLSDSLDGGYPTHMLEQKKVILDSITNTQKVPTADILLKALDKAELMTVINEQTVVNLF